MEMVLIKLLLLQRVSLARSALFPRSSRAFVPLRCRAPCESAVSSVSKSHVEILKDRFEGQIAWFGPHFGWFAAARRHVWKQEAPYNQFNNVFFWPSDLNSPGHGFALWA